MMRETSSPHKFVRTASVAVAGILAVAALSGCSVIAPTAWAITYQVEVEGTGSERLTGVGYGNVPNGSVAFGAETAETTVDEVTTTQTTNGAREWNADVVIAATQPAWVEVTPGPDATAGCRILIDGEREIGSAQGLPGETVRCEVTTPKFTG